MNKDKANTSAINRRVFLKRTAFAAGAASVSSSALWPVRTLAGSANERIRVGVAGLSGFRGLPLVGVFNAQPDVQVTAVCDPDQQRLAAAGGQGVKRYQDYRRLVEDPDIDVIVLATPNHWHAVGAIMACQAGKDVYVEKPMSHSIWEGRKMVEAARQYGRIVQAGTQHRSDPAYHDLRERLARQELGELQWVHSFWYRHREAIGKVSGPQTVPDHIDYDQWCGPRPVVPLMRRQFHYDWHFQSAYGNGDIGNLGAHVIDDVHHGLGMHGDVPTEMVSVGGRFKYDDDADTPNTQLIVLNWKVPIIISSRNLPHVNPAGQRGGDSVYHRFGRTFRFTNLIKCEGGYFAVSRGGGAMYDNDGERIARLPGDGGAAHVPNFIAACRSRSVEQLAADVEEGHRSCLLLHTGNISYRLGRPAPVDIVAQSLGRHEESREAWDQTVAHLQDNGVDLEMERPTLGPWLTFDPATEQFTGRHAEAANQLVRETYRAPFEIPEQV